MFDLTGIRDNFSTQVIILLTIVAFVMIVSGLATQGFARTILTVFGILLLIALVLVLADAPKIGKWIKDQIFNPNVTATILPLKGMIQIWSTTTLENLSSLSRFIL